MENEQKFKVVLVPISGEYSLKQKCEETAHEFECDGIEEFSLDEKTVDNFLGRDSFTAGGSDDNIYAEVESFISQRKGNILKVYFCKNDYSTRADNFFKKLKKKLNLNPQLLELNWEDWNKEWRKYYQPITVSDELRIVPEWEKGDVDPKKDVLIYPGMGFGTGDHQTTYLCLKIFEEIRHQSEVKIKRVFDFGCGSGILGVAALKKISDIYCEFCDIDTRALDNCLQNLVLNFNDDVLSGQRLVSRERYKVDEPFDLIFANILEPVLISESNLLSKSLAKDGYLIVSGILNEQCETISNHYSHLEKLKTEYKDDWAAILFKKL